MDRRKILFPLAVLVVALAVRTLLAATAPTLESAAPERAMPAVRIIEPEPGSVRMWVRSQGTVAPRTESELVPEVSGPVVWVSPAMVSGGYFQAAEPLLRIDARDYEAARSRARAALTRAESEAEYARSELARQQGLSRSSATSASALSGARRSDAVAQAALIDARVALEQAERDLGRTELRAPYAGRVRDERVDVGQFVSRGSSIAKIYAIDFAEVRLPLADAQLAFLELPSWEFGSGPEAGPEVILRARFAGAPHSWNGRIVRSEGEIDPKSRMVHVVARVEDPYGVLARQAEREAEDARTEPGTSAAPDAAGMDQATSEATLARAENENATETAPGPKRPPLTVGLFVRAEIEGPLVPDVLVLPRHALRDGERLLIVDADDRLRSRPAELVRLDGDDVLVRAKLAPGERICVSPLQIVVEGMQVRPFREAAL